MNRHLLPFLLRFEAVAEPAPAEPAAPAEPEPAAPAEPAAAEPVAPAWAGPSQEEWQQTQEALQGLGSFVQQFQQPQPQYEQGPQPPDPDLIYSDPGAYQQQLVAFNEARFAAMLDERMGQLAPMVERPFMQSVEQEIHEHYNALPANLREVPAEIQDDYFNVIQDVAATHFPQVGNDLGRAIQAGAEKLRPLLDAAGKAAVAKYVADMETAANGGRPQEPGVTGGAVSGQPVPKTMTEVGERWIAEAEAAYRRAGSNSNT